jgi:predicted ArsR family transcriptional regulator
LEKILDYLRAHGEQLDADIARALGLTLETVHKQIQHLSDRGDVMTCQVTRFRGTNRIEGLCCRVAGFTPPISPGRKPGR